MREKFLDVHVFGFLSKASSREIRNAFVHQSFRIDSEGNFYIIKNGKVRCKYTKQDLFERMKDLIKLAIPQFLFEVHATKSNNNNEN